MDLWRTLDVGGRRYRYVSLEAADAAVSGAFARLPACLKVLLENVLRRAPAGAMPREALALAGRADLAEGGEIPFHPTRVLMPDSSGLPLIADLAAMRDAAAAAGLPPTRVNPTVPVDLVVDHSLIVDVAGATDAAARNLALEMARNAERLPRVRGPAGRAAGQRHLPSDQPGAPCDGRGGDAGGRPRRRRVRHARRDGQPHPDGERPRRPGLGRRGHRGRDGDAGRADRPADPARRRVPARGTSPGLCEHHRSRPDGDAAPA
jgi:hypothetical protein